MSAHKKLPKSLILIKQLVLCTVFAGLLNTSSAQTNRGLTAYVGKEVLETRKVVLDTMTRQQFLDYGIVQLSDNRFTVSSFTIVLSGCGDGHGIWGGHIFFDIAGNSFNTKEITEMLNVGKECLLVNINNVKFLNFNKQVIDATKGTVLVLIN